MSSSEKQPSSKGQAWFCTTGLPSDIVVEVDDMTFHLHKVSLTIYRTNQFCFMQLKIYTQKLGLFLTIVATIYNFSFL